LAHDARARGAQRGSHRELRHSLDVTTQHEQSQIRAHRYEQEAYCHEQAGQNRLHVAEQGVAQRHRDDGAASQLIPVFVRQLGHHG